MANDFYNHGSFPTTGSAATSASMRAELDSIAAGFDKLPDLTANANKIIVINASSTALTQIATLPVTSGGTGFASYAVGDLVYANTTTTLAKLADIATGNVLLSGGVGVAPSYGKVGLTTHVTGILPVANGGTGITSFGTGVATWLGTPSSANLAAAVTDETGSGALVFANSPTLITPALGTPSSGVVTNLTGTASININGTVGATTPAAGTFTTLIANGNTTLGDASTDTVTVNGYMGVGGAVDASEGLRISNTTLTGITQTGLKVSVTGSSAATSVIRSMTTVPQTAAAAFTVTNIYGLLAQDSIKGAGSTITNQTGIQVNDQTQGTNNFGITSLVSSGANKWNIYASGNAANYFAGSVGIGTNSPSTYSGAGVLAVVGAAPSLPNGLVAVYDSQAAAADVGGVITLGGQDGTIANRAFAAFKGGKENATSGNYASYAAFATRANGGSMIERMRIDSSGNVGIGTTSPNYLLQLHRAAAASSALQLTNTASGSGATDGFGLFLSNALLAEVWQFENGDMRFGTNNTERMRIDSSGNVGIGTSSPASLLHASKSFVTPTGGISASTIGIFSQNNTASASANVSILSRSSGSSVLQFGNEAIENVANIISSGATPYLSFGVASSNTVAASECMRIDSSGNVGIGSSPSYRLHVQFSSAVAYSSSDMSAAGITTFLYNSSVTDSTATTLYMGVNGTSTDAAAAISTVHTSAGNGALAFGTRGGGNVIERMRIDSSGNVGIGTTTPSNLLSVAGNANITGNTTLGDATTDTVTVNGYMGVGGAPATNRAVSVVNTALSGTAQSGVVSNITGTSGATSGVNGFAAEVGTAAAVFTATDVTGLIVQNAFKGAGSTITNQHGVRIVDQTQGTNNYGITSLVSSGANKWNIYASGTAQNYFANNVLIGTTSSRTNPFSSGSFLQIESTSSSASPAIIRNSNDTASGALLLGKSRSTGVGGVTAVTSGDRTGVVAFSGTDGTGLFINARTQGEVDGTVSTGIVPGRLTFYTTNTSGSEVERMRIDSSGNVLIGASISNGKLTIKNPSVSGAQTILRIQGASTTTDLGGLSFNQSTDEFKLEAVTSAGFLTFGTGTGGSERMRIDSSGNVLIGVTSANANGGILQLSKGITFPATQVAATDANTLDDYEEGTFTPTIVGTVVAGTGTYTTQVGRYTKIGNRVHFSITLAWTAHTGTGSMNVGGLPFTSNSSQSGGYFCAVGVANMTFSGQIAARIDNATAVGNIYTLSTGSTFTAVAMDTAATFQMSGTYEV